MSDHFDIMLERKLETRPDQADDAVVVRRMELITGTGRRRRWSIDDKARVLVESFRPGANISEVARQHGISPQQLFAWRREVREPITESADGAGSTSPKPPDRTTEDVPAFAAVVLAAPLKSQGGSQPRSPPPGTGTIEITIGDAIIRVSGHVDLPSHLSAAADGELESDLRARRNLPWPIRFTSRRRKRSSQRVADTGSVPRCS